MIFLFPDLEALRIALTSGQVSPDVSREPVEVAFDAAGRPSVKPHAIPPKAMQNALKRLGIKTAQAHHGEPITLASWPQILPVVRVSGTPEFSATTPVLFELPIAQLGALTTEMLRLGNDRQSFRVLGDTEADQRVLLRVIGPPYYTLLRALDHLNADVAAYLELAPHVWVEISGTHPLAAKIKVADGQMLLLRSPRVWKTIADEPFQDLYEVLDFQLPKAAVAFAEGKLKGKLTVPLRLAAGNAAEVPEMWVLKDNAFDVFDAFVRDADDRLMSRLMFAVAENGERGPVIVLRTRTSKLAPPAIELAGALGYVPYRRLGNLFLPVGTRLQPTLRRDAVRKMLAEDDAQIVWLASSGDGRFIPESLPDAAFRPLPDWVDYVIDQRRQPLQNWMQATRFDFDDFICQEENPLDAPKPPGSGKPKTRKPGERPEKIDGGERSEAQDAKDKKKSKAKDDASYASQAPAKPDELKIERTALERAFLAIEGPLDAPDRLAYWPRLAQLNAALGDHAEAAICWLNGLWEMDEIPADAARAWLEGEEAAPRKELKKADIDRLLAIENPLKTDLRRLAATLLYAATREPATSALKDRLPAIRAYLEKHDAGLPVRAVWLVWKDLARLSGDVLGLARIRDRLLDRLMEKKGLDLGLDAPTFIDLADQKDGERIRQMRDRAIRLHRAVQQWHDRSAEASTDAYDSPAVNKPFVDLVFAFGLAVLGQENIARDLIQSAARVLLTRPHPNDKKKLDDVGAFLHKAMLFRIERALNKEAHEGSLPPELLNRIEEIDAAHRTSANHSTERYVIDRFREQSWVLEPNERFDPYAAWRGKQDWLAEVGDLTKERDPRKLEEKIRRLLREGSSRAKAAPEQRFLILNEALACAWRVGRDFALELAALVPSVLDSLKAPSLTWTTDIAADLKKKQALFLERAIYLAGHYGDREAVQKLFQRFLLFVREKSGQDLHEAINQIARECLRNLRKVGLQDEIGDFLRQVTELVIQGQSPSQIKSRSGKNWPEVLRTLVHLAEGWLFNRNAEQAQPLLEEARSFLFAKGKAKSAPLVFPRVAQAYVCALAQAPVEEALTQIEEMFLKMDEMPNGFTSKNWYSRFHLVVVEEVVRTMVSENFTLSETARRFLDDDEYLVRRRIHGEMRKLLAQSGL